ncbi:major facilitator superfamily domain-containing protein [Mycena filopes]|nr:major facilitator superfamily domain-containing protein [Mycena filopes]
MAVSEDTPLLALKAAEHLWRKGPFSAYRRVLLATFLLSTTFAFTATPLYYAYRIFNCQEYYDNPAHAPYEGDGDACAIGAIDAGTARDIAVMITLTTFSGTLNLIVTTWQIKNWGLRKAIVNQTCWPALRNLTQIYATLVGNRRGITIMQSTQLITILGGGAGYLLSANSYMAEVVAPEERTAAFGVLAGIAMLGVATGYICGGLSNDYINLSAPFEITFCLLVASTFFTAFCLPYIPVGRRRELDARKEKDDSDSVFSFLHCLKIFFPAKYADGSKGRFWGLPLLGLGAFLSVTATAYVPLMLQLTATNQYGFKPGDNGFLMSSNALSRAAFLTLAFPRIIAYGRKRLFSVPTAASVEDDAAAVHNEPATNAPKRRGSAFDLAFLRYSMVIDTLLVALLVFSTTSAHIWAAALILPLASGTAPACKGVLLDMVPARRKSDALSAIALVETTAMITTVALSDALFAFLSQIGRPNLVFLFNALTALLSAAVLFAVRFPRGALA